MFRSHKNVEEAYSFHQLHLYMWSEKKLSNLCGYWTLRAFKGVKHNRPCNEHKPPMCTPSQHITSKAITILNVPRVYQMVCSLCHSFIRFKIMQHLYWRGSYLPKTIREITTKPWVLRRVWLGGNWTLLYPHRERMLLICSWLSHKKYAYTNKIICDLLLVLKNINTKLKHYIK